MIELYGWISRSPHPRCVCQDDISHMEVEDKQELRQSPLCLQTHSDHSYSTSTLQQSDIKSSLHLFPVSIMSCTLFIFHTPCGCRMKQFLIQTLVAAPPARRWAPSTQTMSHIFNHFGHPNVSKRTNTCLNFVIGFFFFFLFCLSVRFLFTTVFWHFKPSVACRTAHIGSNYRGLLRWVTIFYVFPV